jgi:hypothetical protein
MILAEKGRSATAASLWYVTNGDTVVGPVDTDLLLRGITNARIPGDCMVTQESWSSWRGLHQIREASRVGRTPSWAEGSEVTGASQVTEELVRKAHDAGEALLFAMQAAVTATRATAGLVHRMREPFVGLVTSSAQGKGIDDQLGQVIPRLDVALAIARIGRTIIGLPHGSGPARAIARRFSGCGEVKGVAMVPVFDGGVLLAMLELARADHPFRAGDREVLLRIAQMVCLR